MGCSDAFKPDFFNNVAAVAVVLIFAKVVAHRMQEKQSSGRAVRHGVAVGAAVLATGFALWATAVCVDSSLWLWLAGGSLTIAALLFVYEIIRDDVLPAPKAKTLAVNEIGDR